MENSTFSIIFLAFYLAIGPGLFWFWFYYQKGRAGRIPNKLLGKLFLAGCIATIAAIGLEWIPDKILPQSLFACISGYCNTNDPYTVLSLLAVTFLIIAPIEEGLKYVAIKWTAFRQSSFNQIIDGVKYGVAVGLGFATVENAVYLIRALGAGDYNQLVTTLVLRFLLSTLAHTLYSGIMGYYIGRARFDVLNQKKLLAKGVIYAIIAHGAFNFLLFAQTGPLAIALLAFLGWLIYREYREAKNLEIQRQGQGLPNLPYLETPSPDEQAKLRSLQSLRDESRRAQRPKTTLEGFLEKRKWGEHGH